MQIIPVIDLKDGQVVHAVRGNRAHYQPIHHHSRLTDSSAVEAVLAGFWQLYPFECFYLADLNAITGNGDHGGLIRSLLENHPAIEFWVDNGCQLAEIDSNQSNRQSVIGTESQLTPPCPSDRDFILSLDFKQQQPAGLPAWFEETAYWPQRIIAMTLSRVGSNSGPDFAKLTELIARHPERSFIAAGGIRHTADLHSLSEIGIETALVASALHSGAITGDDIKKLQAKKYPGKPGHS